MTDTRTPDTRTPDSLTPTNPAHHSGSGPAPHESAAPEPAPGTASPVTEESALEGLAVEGHAVEEPAEEAVVGDAVEEPAEEPAVGQESAGEEPDGEEAAVVPPVAGGRRATLEREGEVAADFLETLLDICDADGDLEVDVEGDRALVSIVDSEDGRVPRRLVGPDGSVLEALQELTRLAVQSVTGDRSRLMLDVAGHRAERRAGLVARARDAVAVVRRTGERAELEPMTAFERKVVHDEVLASGLRSESEGSEPRRFVVVLPA
jgi:spoIIIJ-associated protein